MSTLMHVRSLAKGLLSAGLVVVLMGMGPKETSELLQQGVSQYGAKQFTAAKATFLRVQQNRDDLSDNDREILDKHAIAVNDAISRQSAVLKKYETAQADLKAGKTEEAAKLFTEVSEAVDWVPADVIQQADASLKQITRQQPPARIAAAQQENPPALAQAQPQDKTGEPIQQAQLDAAIDQANAQAAADNKAMAANATSQPSAEASADANKAEASQKMAENKAEADAAMGKTATTEPQTASATVDLSQPSVGPVPGQSQNPLVSDYIIVRDIKKEKAIKQFNDQRQKILNHVQQTRFDLARGDLAYARQVIEANKIYFSPQSEFDALLAQSAELGNYIDQAEIKFNDESIKTQQAAISEAVKKADDDRAKAMAARKQQLLDQARQLIKERRLTEALDKLREIQAIDPMDNNVRFLADSLQTTIVYRNSYREIEEAKKSFQIAANQDEARMKYANQLLEFPKNWKEISQKRSIYGSDQTSEDQATRETRRKLQTVIPEFRFDAVPLEQVITLLQELTGVNISVDSRSLEASGINRDTPVSANLRDISFEKALQLLLADLGGPDVKLGYDVQDGVLRISTKAQLDANLTVRVYDISDLVLNVPDFVGQEGAPELNLLSSVSAAGGGGAGIFAGGAAGTAAPAASADSKADEIVNLITETVEKDSWVAAGGLANIRKFGTTIVVTQTTRGHAKVADLLRQFRASRAVQVNIDCRFLEVENNYLEEMGVDIDLVMNQGNAGFDMMSNAAGQPFLNSFGNAALAQGTPYGTSGARTLLPRRYSQAGFVPTNVGANGAPPTGLTQAPQAALAQPYGQVGLVPAQGSVVPFQGSDWTPVPILQNSLAMTDTQTIRPTPLVDSSWAGQAIAPAFTIFGSFLDNLQVDFMVRATQANRRSTLLQAPRLTLYNGQRAWIAVLREQAYVSDVTPVVAEAVSAYDPTVSSVSTGAVLDVQATVSADRKYVTLTVRPSTSIIVNFRTFTFQLGGGATTVSASIQLPEIRRTVLKTTATVPDGGTLVLGGQTIVGEVELEAGVPVLSKIPVLNCAFDNRSMVKDTRTLLVLIKPTIIIAAEGEEQVNPTLGQPQ